MYWTGLVGLIGVSLFFSACSTTEIRTKHSDAKMTVMLDPAAVNERNYVRVTNALVSSGKWRVIDRGFGFKAAKKEQDREHREENDRFENSKKYAWFGKLHGVGSVIVPFSECWYTRNIFTDRMTQKCRLSLQVVDTATAEIITTVEDDASSSPSETCDWTDVVAKLDNSFPEKFEEFKKTKRLIKYEKTSEELAILEQKKNEVDAGRAE